MSSQQRIGALDARGWTAESGARLKAAVRAAKWQQEKLAEAAGVARSTLATIFSGSSTPRQATLEAICEVIGADLDEIIGGARERVGSPNLSRPLAGDVRIGEDEYSVVNRHEVNVSAGPGLIPVSESASGGLAFSRSWLIQRGIAADLSALVTVKGDSMSPTIPDGATLLVQRCDPALMREGVFIFSRGGEVFVKRLMPIDIAANGRAQSIVITSDNPEYRPEIVRGADLGDIRIIGRVHCVLCDV